MYAFSDDNGTDDDGCKDTEYASIAHFLYLYR